MRCRLLSLLLLYPFLCFTQNPYEVKTKNPTKESEEKISEEQKFVLENFPTILMADWKAGMRFMVEPDKYNIGFDLNLKPQNKKNKISMTVKNFEWKIFTVVGIEEREVSCPRGKCTRTYVIFECDGENYEYEYIGGGIEELREATVFDKIDRFIYLDEVDKAKKLLIGKQLSFKAEKYYTDQKDKSDIDKSIWGKAPIEIVDVGIGTQVAPVKIIFKHKGDNTEYYYLAKFSKTNEGIGVLDSYSGDWFYNAFSFKVTKMKKVKLISFASVPRKIEYKEKYISFEDNISNKTVKSIDSTKNYLGENVFAYIGQELSLPTNYSLDKSMKIFTCTNVLIKKNIDKLDEISSNYYGNYYLELVEKNTKDTVYFHYENNEYDYQDFEFKISSYLEKKKKQYLDKKFVFKDNIIDDKSKTGSIWTCVEIKDFQYLIFENEEKTRMLQYITFMDDNPNYYFSMIKVNQLKNKFGVSNFNLILSGKVKVGMTKEMCEYSWGKPEDINKTTGSWGIHEQWVYSGGSYLYFENGILKTIQN